MLLVINMFFLQQQESRNNINTKVFSKRYRRASYYMQTRYRDPPPLRRCSVGYIVATRPPIASAVIGLILDRSVYRSVDFCFRRECLLLTQISSASKRNCVFQASCFLRPGALCFFGLYYISKNEGNMLVRTPIRLPEIV